MFPATTLEALDQYREIVSPENQKTSVALKERARISRKVGLYTEAFSSYLELSDIDIENRAEDLWAAAWISLVNLDEYQSGTETLRLALDAGFTSDDAFDQLLDSVHTGDSSVD